MTEEYYCDKCQRFVGTIQGEFKHPDRGYIPCLICAVCKSFMVYLKKLEDKVG